MPWPLRTSGSLRIYRTTTGLEGRVSVATAGTLGRLCLSADFESMGARVAAGAKANAHPDWKALMAKESQEAQDGTVPFVPGTVHDGLWRDA